VAAGVYDDPVATEFWDQIYSDREVAIAAVGAPVMQAALAHFGDVRGKRLLDLGCGAGEFALAFAALGADAVALDLSEVAVAKLQAFADERGVPNLRALQGSAMAIDQHGPFDLVFGSFILHHLEPFPAFANALQAALAPGGKAFFHENNAGVGAPAIWFRQHLAGKWWFPKHGDADEFPLTPGEVGELRKRFVVAQSYPELALFRLVSHYVLRNKLIPSAFAWLDETLYHVPAVRGFSYYQDLGLTKPI